MADVFSKSKRSHIMSRIRGRDTRPELAIRSLLHKLGYRFRLHVAALPGRPDIVLAKYRTVIMVHGCFWHRHSACKFAYVPKTRRVFWRKKFTSNVERDRRVELQLRELGWRVIVLWECELGSSERLSRRLTSALRAKYKRGTPYLRATFD